MGVHQWLLRPRVRRNDESRGLLLGQQFLGSTRDRESVGERSACEGRWPAVGRWSANQRCRGGRKTAPSFASNRPPRHPLLQVTTETSVDGEDPCGRFGSRNRIS